MIASTSGSIELINLVLPSNRINIIGLFVLDSAFTKSNWTLGYSNDLMSLGLSVASFSPKHTMM